MWNKKCYKVLNPVLAYFKPLIKSTFNVTKSSSVA